MLKVFRDNLRRLAWILWIVIAVFVLLVFAEVNTGETAATGPDSMAAKVGRHTITYGEFEREYRSLEDRFRQAYGDAYTSDLARQMGVPMQAMNRLIFQKIELDEARRLGLEPTEDELRRAILEVPAFQDERGQFIGIEEYKELLKANRIPVERFERDMRQDVMLRKFNEVLAQSVWISDAEVERFAREQAEKASIEYAQLTPDQLADQAVEVSDDELTTYFAENRADFQQPEERRVAYVEVNINTLRAELEIPTEDLRAYYDSNSEEFTREEQVRAQHILRYVNQEHDAATVQQELETVKTRLEAGEDFNTLAAELSEDESTASRGGDLGFFGRGQMTPEFETAAFAGAQGEIVGPIENQLGPRTGYHLIKIIARQEGGVQPFEEVENRIRVRLLNEGARGAAEQKAAEVQSQLASLDPLTEEAMRAVAVEENLTLTVTEPFSREENVPTIGAQTPFTTTAFGLEPGELSEPVRIGAGWAVLSVLEVEPPRIPELSEITDAVRAAAETEARRGLAKERLAGARERIAAGEDFTAVLGEMGLAPQTSASFGAQGSVVGVSDSDALVSAALELESGDLGETIDDPGGPILFRVTEREHFDAATFGQEREALREQLEARRFNALLTSLFERRQKEMGITFNPQFLETFEVAPPVEG